jgi:hypothetical protein
MDGFLAAKGRLLEDEFFAKQDDILIKKLRELEQMERTQKALAAVSGITNEAILKHLVELDIHPDLLATLALVPLVEVAWADGDVHEDERKAILAGSTRLGMGPTSVDYVLLEEWLQQKPPEKMLNAWIVYIRGLCEVLSSTERNEIRTLFLSRARQVAEASGGFLGLTSRISEKEEAMLKKLESAFGT